MTLVSINTYFFKIRIYTKKKAFNNLKAFLYNLIKMETYSVGFFHLNKLGFMVSITQPQF